MTTKAMKVGRILLAALVLAGLFQLYKSTRAHWHAEHAVQGGHGGNIILVPGKGGMPEAVPGERAVQIPGVDGSIIFRLADGTEVIRIDPDGGCYVRGERVEKNAAVWRAVREWFSGACHRDVAQASPEKRP